MRTLVLIALIALSGCSGNTIPLAHTRASDPVWALNADKWSPPGGNNLTQPPTLPAGRIPQQTSN